MKKHGARWQQLPAQTKDMFEHEAALSAAERREENRCEAERVRAAGALSARVGGPGFR